MKAIFSDLIEAFERTTGHKLIIAYGTAGLMRDRIRAGEIADVAVMQRYLLDDLFQQDKIPLRSIADVARSPIGLFRRLGGPKPDITSIEKLRQVLLAAESITYTDPADGGLSGTHFVKVLDRLGITEQMKQKTKLGRPGVRVTNGEVEFGILQVSEILPLPRVQLVDRLPEQLQDNTPVSAALIKDGPQPEAGTEFIKFLFSPIAVAAIKVHGMEPIEGGHVGKFHNLIVRRIRHTTSANPGELLAMRQLAAWRVSSGSDSVNLGVSIY
jgi:molybdate transport system substrate-binding protein